MRTVPLSWTGHSMGPRGVGGHEGPERGSPLYHPPEGKAGPASHVDEEVAADLSTQKSLPR